MNFWVGDERYRIEEIESLKIKVVVARLPDKRLVLLTLNNSTPRQVESTKTVDVLSGRLKKRVFAAEIAT